MKVISSDRGRLSMYDLNRDANERTNLAGTQPARAMRVRLDSYLDSLPPPGPQPPRTRIDRQTEEALRNLGYVE